MLEMLGMLRMQQVRVLEEAFGGFLRAPPSQPTPHTAAPIPIGHFAQTWLLVAQQGWSSPTHKPRFIPDCDTSGVWDLHLCLELGLVANLLK